MGRLVPRSSLWKKDGGVTTRPIVDDALVALVGAETEQALHEALAVTIHELLPGSFIVVHTLVQGTDHYQVTTTAGLERVLQPAGRLIGFDPLKATYSLDGMDAEDVALYRTGRVEHLPGGLYELTLHKLPKAACLAIERLANIRGSYAIGFVWEESHYGGVSFCLQSDPHPDQVREVEALVRLATVAMRRMRAEALLRVKEEELDAFFSHSLDLLCIADTGGFFRRLNPEWERTLGYPLDELEGRRFLDLVHPDDVPATLGAVARLAQGRSETRFVNRYRHRDGQYRWLEWRSFPRGELIYAAARDLTERIQAEHAVQQSEARYRLIADNTADVIWMLDLATARVTFVSPSVERLRGYPVHEVLQQTMEEVLTPDSFARVSASLPGRIAAVESGDESQRINIDEVDQPCRDGSVVPTEVTTCMLSDESGRVVEVLGVSRDISERRQAEAQIKALTAGLEARVRERTAQLEEAVTELEGFSYSVSHDLRTPLRAINGYATILKDDHGDALGPDGRELCERVVAGTRRMGQLIDDLLAFARLGRTQLADDPVDMTGLFEAVVAEADVPRVVRIDVRPLAPTRGDPVLLRQVCVNLIDNAVKFSCHREEPCVEVGCSTGGSENVYYVRDNGEGFDMRYVAKLFQVFERLHDGECGGSGIGLAIVRRAVEAHGGRVWAEGAPDEGATFFFALPAAQEA